MVVRSRWYQQPVVWLGVTLLAAVVVGGIATIMVASSYVDEPLPAAADTVFKVPARRPGSSP